MKDYEKDIIVEAFATNLTSLLTADYHWRHDPEDRATSIYLGNALVCILPDHERDIINPVMKKFLCKGTITILWRIWLIRTGQYGQL